MRGEAVREGRSTEKGWPPATTDLTVPFVTLDRQHAQLTVELTDAFMRVVDTSAFILGDEVEAFEAEFASYCGATHAVGVASGTAAIKLMLCAAGLGPGDEVIVPAHTFIASALGVVHAGATPVFCDVNAHTGLIDPIACAAAVTPRTTAILAVHLYGQACDMDALRPIATTHGLRLFEDAAQAHGAMWGERRAGALADGAAFSFYPSKNLGALGDAGAVVTSDRDLADGVRRLRHLGQRAKGEHIELGYNERLDGLQAAMLRVKLAHLDDAIAARRAWAEVYHAGLEGLVEVLAERVESPCTYHLYPIRVADRGRLAASLLAAGIQTGVHYSPALHMQPPLMRFADPQGYPEAEAWAQDELSLPMSAELRSHEVAHVVRTIARELARSDHARS